jgi:hypothetical protein
MSVVEFAWENPLVTVIVLGALIWGALLLLQQHLSKQEDQEDAGSASVEDEPHDADNRFYSPERPKQTTPAAPLAAPSEPEGKLNDEDGRLLQELLFMSCSLTGRVPELTSALVTQALNNWALAPDGGPGVHSLLLSWARAKFAEDGGATHQPEKEKGSVGTQFRGSFSGFGKRTKAAWEDPAAWSSRLLEAVEGDVAHWGRARISGRFYFVSEGAEGQAHLVQHKGDTYTCYEVLGMGKSVGDELRAAGGTVGSALLTLTLLPFEGKLVSDGRLQLEEYRGGKNLEKRLQEAVREATEAGTLVRALDLMASNSSTKKPKAKRPSKPKSA